MTTLFTAIFTKYLTGALLTILVGVFTKISLKYFGNDRTQTIKDAIITAMLYAEETFGMGHGNEKWTEAWQKLLELLQTKGIKLTPKEITSAKIEMKANVPEVNSIAYTAKIDKTISKRETYKLNEETQNMVDILKAKHSKKNPKE
jgi:hypothetical protein